MAERSEGSPSTPSEVELRAARKARRKQRRARRAARLVRADETTQWHRLLTVADACAASLGYDVFREAVPKIGFAHVVDLHAPDPGPDMQAPVYDAYLSNLRNASIHGGSSFVLLPGEVAVYDVAADPELGQWARFSADPLFRRRDGDRIECLARTPTKTIERGFLLSGFFSEHFGHWICEYLPKLRHLERLPGWESVPIIVNDDMPSTHYEMLALMLDNPVIRIARNELVHVRELYVAPTIAFIPPDYTKNHAVPVHRQSAWSKEAMLYMRTRILQNCGVRGESSEKILLSRRKRSWAVPYNNDEIENTFQSLDFRSILPEEMTFAQQISCISTASFIAAPSGSALNLAMFAPIGTPVLVLAQGSPHNWGGWLGPMRDIGYDARFLMSEQSNARIKGAQYSIDCSQIERAVYRMRLVH